jgi:sec-independent protein translocase protein TatB
VFDVSFVELMIIGVVALIVLGPEKLPGAARTVGGLLRRARASWQSVRSEIERELAAEELKRNMADMKSSVDAATSTFNEPAAGYGHERPTFAPAKTAASVPIDDAPTEDAPTDNAPTDNAPTDNAPASAGRRDG